MRLNWTSDVRRVCTEEYIPKSLLQLVFSQRPFGRRVGLLKYEIDELISPYTPTTTIPISFPSLYTCIFQNVVCCSTPPLFFARDGACRRCTTCSKRGACSRCRQHPVQRLLDCHEAGTWGRVSGVQRLARHTAGDSLFCFRVGS